MTREQLHDRIMELTRERDELEAFLKRHPELRNTLEKDLEEIENEADEVAEKLAQLR